MSQNVIIYEPLTYGDYRIAAKDIIGCRILPALGAFPQKEQGTLEGGIRCFYKILCFGLDLFQNMIVFSRIKSLERNNLFFQKTLIEIPVVTKEHQKIIKINNPFVLIAIEYLCCLEYLQCLSVQLEFEKPNETLYKYWPYAPGAIVFTESGYSVFEATNRYLEDIYISIQEMLMGRYFGLAGDEKNQTIYNAGEENLRITPEPTEIVRFWIEDCLSYLQMLIPEESYSDIKLSGELESIRYKLQSEFCQFEEQAIHYQEIEISSQKNEKQIDIIQKTELYKMETISPKVFISYSHDSEENKKWVLNLATRLRESGVDVILDQWDLKLGNDVAKFMESSANADRVLMICTEIYVNKADGGKGGAGYEAMIVTGELLRDLGTTKFIPVIRQSSGEIKLPKSVSTRAYVNLSDDQMFEQEFNRLLRDLHQVPAISKPPLGENPFKAE